MNTKTKTNMSEKVNIILSESFMVDHVDLTFISEVLDEAIAEFVDNDERIINIETKECGGQSRFWIYTTKT